MRSQRDKGTNKNANVKKGGGEDSCLKASNAMIKSTKNKCIKP